MRPQCLSFPEISQQVVRDGIFSRYCDSRHIQQFRCKTCGVGFSASTAPPRYRQKCRRINPRLKSLFCKGLPQRELTDELKEELHTFEHTKCKPRLGDHVTLYIDVHNRQLVKSGVV